MEKKKVEKKQPVTAKKPETTKPVSTLPNSQSSKKAYESKIRRACEKLKATLIRKNAAYGGSVFTPSPFTQNGTETAISVRFGDKINRLEQLINRPDEFKGVDEMIEDTLLDVAGYAVLWLIAREEKKG